MHESVFYAIYQWIKHRLNLCTDCARIYDGIRNREVN